ncbi:MAG: phospholipase D family protein [candidate division NC10 bacterium]|nr:phospholipase D family protein [candidate division NC10 bacterium]
MRKSLIALCLVMVLAFLALLSLPRVKEVPLGKAAAAVYFSPNGGCTEAIIKEIEKAQSEILVQAYTFTSAPIAKALLRAHQRGIRAEVILDQSQRMQKYSSATFLANQKIPIYIDGQHGIAHNKVMIIDRKIVITGSFNFTRAAEEKNAENLLVIRSEGLAKAYLENWQRHKKHSEEYRRG